MVNSQTPLCVMRGRQASCLVALMAAAQLALVGTEPQGLGVQVNNGALFTLGAGLLAIGAGYYIGRQTAVNQYRNGHRPYNGFSPSFGRRRRQVVEPNDNETDLLVGRLFQLVLEKDKSGCSLQLTCSIGSTPSSSLLGNARNLYSILSGTLPEADDDGDASGNEWQGLFTYQEALAAGADGDDCDQLYPSCLASSHQLLTHFQSMKIVEK